MGKPTGENEENFETLIEDILCLGRNLKRVLSFPAELTCLSRKSCMAIGWIWYHA